ncbi:MAG: FKBP-type peptidyl-prolyl cis-trans isomerase [Balneolaceae bacterium]|nr:FKBP-type peptidyl-prolyl cis-trans isomerase [Balneolaceae bacterium]
MIHQKLTFSIVASVMMIAMIITGCDSDSFEGEADLESNIDSVSYAFGFLNGQQLSQQGMSDLDPELFAKGMQQAMNEDSSQINKDTLRSLLQSYQMKAQAKAQRQRAAEAQENQEAGEKFLAENKTKEGVQTTESGLQYKVLEEGSGASPTAEDTVTVNYKGTLLNGEVFDSSYERGQPADIPLNRVIPGWTEGIQLMKEGGKYKFWIPGDLAYGPNPRPGGPIGPNETLIFEVELIEVK